MSSSPRRARADAPADARERRPSPATAPWGSACQQRAPPLQTAPPPRSAGPPPPPPEEAAAAAAFWTSLRLEGRTVSGRRRASSGPSLGTSRTSRLGCGSAQRTRPGPAVAPAHEKARNLLMGRGRGRMRMRAGWQADAGSTSPMFSVYVLAGSSVVSLDFLPPALCTTENSTEPPSEVLNEN